MSWYGSRLYCWEEAEVGAQSKIEWTDATWNPVMGCTPVSGGCKNCYARSMMARFAGQKGWPETASTVTLFPERLTQPLRWRKPQRVFVCSMSDLFHGDVPPWFVCEIWQVMRECPQHVFQVLTKRSRNMLRLLRTYIADHELGIEPLSNVWLGVTVENQATADARRADFEACPAAVKFVSYEPALGPVDWTGWEFVDQIISGGESGPGARPSYPDWHRVTRDFCQENNIAYFFKQHGRWVEMGQVGALACKSVDNYQRGLLSHGKLDGQAFRQASPWGALGPKMLGVGKKRAGRLLDGQEWNEYPEVRA